MSYFTPQHTGTALAFAALAGAVVSVGYAAHTCSEWMKYIGNANPFLLLVDILFLAGIIHFWAPVRGLV